MLIYIHFPICDLIIYTEADDPPVSPGDILNFFIGCEYPPPMGFDTKYTQHPF